MSPLNVYSGSYIDNLGLCYFEGAGGFENNNDKAHHWLMQSAEQGFTLGQYQLALLLDRIGAEIDATQWYQRAAESGNPAAQFNLGINYKQVGTTNKLCIARSVVIVLFRPHIYPTHPFSLCVVGEED